MMTSLDTSDDIAGILQARLVNAAGWVSDLDADVQNVTDLDDLAHLLVALRDLKWTVGAAFDRCERHLASELEAQGRRHLDVKGVGRLERKRKIRRTGWKHDELLPVLVAKSREEVRFNADTGERETDLEAALRVIRDCISFGAGKVRGLRARGLAEDEWCEVQDDGFGIQLPSMEHGR